VALKLGAHLAKLGRLPEAIDALILARSQGKGPQRAQALEGLEKTYRATQRWQELAEVIDARAGDLRLKNALELMLERAKILEERLGREDLARTIMRDDLYAPYGAPALVKVCDELGILVPANVREFAGDVRNADPHHEPGA